MPNETITLNAINGGVWIIACALIVVSVAIGVEITKRLKRAGHIIDMTRAEMAEHAAIDAALDKIDTDIRRYYQDGNR